LDNSSLSFFFCKKAAKMAASSLVPIDWLKC
jgi:hypothetical protein